jgi:hypothetical protein
MDCRLVAVIAIARHRSPGSYPKKAKPPDSDTPTPNAGVKQQNCDKKESNKAN